MESLYVNEESLPGRREPAAGRGERVNQLDKLLEVAEQQAALAELRGDSYAELLVVADGITASGRAQPVAVLRLGAEFRGIAFAGR